VALARDRSVLDVHVYRGIELRILPERGPDIGGAWYCGYPLAWISGVGEGGAASSDWRRAWGGLPRDYVRAGQRRCAVGRRDEGARVTSDADEIIPQDAEAAAFSGGEAPKPVTAPERVWEHVGATRAGVVNEGIGMSVTVTSKLPRLWQWVESSPGVYAFGLAGELLGARACANDRAQGRLPMLEPGEGRETRLTIEVEVA
jgi:hypothetical protein